MERDAFKIPLRPNPSTLPNVLPTILHARSQAFKTKQKSFSFILFQESMSYLINTHHVPGDGPVLLLGRCGQAEWFSSLLTQLSREWIKGLARAWTQVPSLSLCPKSNHVVQNYATHYWSCILPLALTQVCTVWSFIHHVSAAGSLGHLDPNRVMTSFSICPTPPAKQWNIETHFP